MANLMDDMFEPSEQAEGVHGDALAEDAEPVDDLDDGATGDSGTYPDGPSSQENVAAEYRAMLRRYEEDK